MATAEADVIVQVTQAGRRQLSVVLDAELVMGRDCDGLLIADSEVSRRHLRLRRRGRAVEVVDLGSTNGTFKAGVRLTEPDLIDRTSHYSIGYTDVTVVITPRQPTAPVRGGGQVTEIRTSEEDLRNTSIHRVAETLRLHGPGGVEANGDRSGHTVTLVFSDIESSTERATAMGDAAWYALLERHNRLFRSRLQRWGGEEVKSIGDGFMLSFPSVRRALMFAIDIQRDVASDGELDLRVRMGLHTGEAIIDKTGDLFGRHVNLAARVANLATGGQILASDVAREIATAHDDIEFGEAMVADVKGFAGSQRVFPVVWQPAPAAAPGRP